MTERAIKIAMNAKTDQNHQRQAAVEQRILESRFAEHNPENTWNGDCHSVGPAGDSIEFGEQGIEDHRNGKIQHREENRAIANEKCADHGTGQPGCQHRQRDKSSKVIDASARQEGDAIGACGKEHGVTDRDQSGAKQDRHTKRRKSLRNRQGQDELKPRSEYRRDSQGKNRRDSKTYSHHILRAVTEPNSP